ncbi:MAG: PQQ-dependent dehydrogenase, methanol/ethanol family [Gammaproteobacteria bacterium]|nr:PQQ-dependent dehydrogenase, methanol/ethanol family [Gammaproteobacteria bacterium]MDH5309924.1 PQQ-dependent dehydrogenase, methanol/ethanol family [Gammaproteobacteria bacterium]
MNKMIALTAASLCRRGSIGLAGIALVLAACGREAPPADESQMDEPAAGILADVDGARIAAADGEPGNWLAHGRTYNEQRYSPLDQINSGNVANLGLAWYYDLDTNRGQEATPIVVDGVMFVSTAWSKVKALDAATGALLWDYDPQVPGQKAADACCDVVNRGVAVWKGRVYLGALDGRLIALDAATGEVAWSVQTTDTDRPYTITGAPRVYRDKVVIGNGGAEFGVRGYVSAYDTDTGELAWRFYTVPGNPADGFESPAVEAAAETWTGQWWKHGGGGTVWDAIVYDPELNLVYIGVGNGAPWNQSIRSPGGGDNLYLSSIVALNGDTGEYVWHYQTTPGETWDFTATQPLILAELEIDGAQRKVIMQAPKNGFFYVLDRRNGEFISAAPFTTVTWASGIDENGRPIENPESRYYATQGPAFVKPGPGGAHSWHPMSYSLDTGLVYFPVTDAAFPYINDPEYVPTTLGFNTGVDFNAGSMPQIPEVKEQILGSVKAFLLAWDPVAQKPAWTVDYPGPSNGGVLSTAGNIVVQGTAGGDVVIYRADNGEKLWSMHAQTGVQAGPATYLVDGEQYISVAAGWGGIYALAPGEIGLLSGRLGNKSRILAFKLGGQARLPEAEPLAPLVFTPPATEASGDEVQHGKFLYHRHCVACHGDAAVSAGMLPDLRATPMLHGDAFQSVVLGGALVDRGMVSFAEELDENGVEAIRAYLVARAHESAALAGQVE